MYSSNVFCPTIDNFKILIIIVISYKPYFYRKELYIMASKYYVARINPKTLKKTITLDTNVAPSAAELVAVETYVKAGYEIRFKSEKRAAAARERAKQNGFGKKKEAAE